MFCTFQYLSLLFFFLFFWTSTRSVHNYQLDAFQFFAVASTQHVLAMADLMDG